ncbi:MULTISPECIES: hypothetical protein [unclassified Yoonia]|uniref:hypothetical protein n=1 Tax=unclassified Yoonia TaxID=2629118 RepID=UPI002AFF475A|nr:MULTISPECIES: hypothetical protein [unclassified Yoonia]
MDLIYRRDQFSYFLGFTSKGSERFLNEAIRIYAHGGYKTPSPSDVFQHCPFNDTLAQIIRGVHVFESGKKLDLANNLYNMLAEFMFLASDFEPPCCGDGRAFYEKTASGEIVLACDRCGAAYSLDTSPIQSASRMRMTKPQFVEIFGESTAKDWPYHRKLKALLAVSRF